MKAGMISRKKGSVEAPPSRGKRFGPAVRSQEIQMVAPWANHAYPIQASLKVNAPGDRYEQEADRVAARIMGGGDTAVQRKTCSCGKPAGPDGMCEDCKRQQNVRRKAAGEGGETAAPPVVGRVLAEPGRPLDGPTRNFMESRFGENFNGVRVHTGSQAGEAAERIRARAFTAGRDIVFGRNEYAPQSAAGRELLAHELVHVLQQGGGEGSQTVSRYYIDDCDAADKDLRSSADGRATSMSKKAVSELESYREDYPKGNAKQSVTDLLVDNFGFEGSGKFLDVIIKGFRKVRDKFVADDYTYECEDDCDGEYAYVYWAWSDIHICMNKLRKKGVEFAAHVFLHEMSHYIAGTDDLEYYYYGSPAQTSLHPTDAVSNADSYEAFAAELYKKG